MEENNDYIIVQIPIVRETNNNNNNINNNYIKIVFTALLFEIKSMSLYPLEINVFTKRR